MSTSSGHSQPQQWMVDDVKEALARHTVRYADKLAMSTASVHDLILVDSLAFKDKEGKSCFAAAITTKQLLAEPARLSNQEYIKAAVDGTFKELFGSRCTIHAGALSKRYTNVTASTSSGIESWQKFPCWATHFNSVVHVLCSSEKTEAVELGLRALGDIAMKRDGTPVAPAIMQVHQDWAPQQEKAHPHSHLVGEQADLFL